MIKQIKCGLLFFLAGWFSCVIGFEVSSTAGNISAILLFCILLLFAEWRNKYNPSEVTQVTYVFIGGCVEY